VLGSVSIRPREAMRASPPGSNICRGCREGYCVRVLCCDAADVHERAVFVACKIGWALEFNNAESGARHASSRRTSVP
jgi:hypothetical protein